MVDRRPTKGSAASATRGAGKEKQKVSAADPAQEPLPPPRQVSGRLAHIQELALKAIFPEADVRWDKDDLLDVIYWIRQVVAIVCGLVWGFIPITGFYGFIGALAVNILAVLSWYRMQSIDEEEFGGHTALATEGLPPAVSLFLILWIVVYSFAHP